MKIRNGYVSNSSSSSFVLNDKKDFDFVVEMISKSFAYLVKSKEWSSYKISAAKLEKALKKSVKKSDDSDAVRTYIFNLFYYVVMHYSWYYGKVKQLKENDACIGCTLLKHHKCLFRSRRKEKENCFWKYDFKHMMDERQNALNYLKNFPFKFPLYLLKECRKQQDENVKISNTKDGMKFVQSDLKYDEMKKLIEKEVDKWMVENPNHCFLEFASDDGNSGEAVLRYNLGKYVMKARKQGIQGFFSDNS